MIRTRNFRGQNERIETGVLFKNQTRRKVSSERRVGEALSGKQLDIAQKETPVVSTTDQTRLLMLEKQTQTDGRKASKSFGPRDKVLLEGKARKRKKNHQRTACGSVV